MSEQHFNLGKDRFPHLLGNSLSSNHLTPQNVGFWSHC